MHQPLPLGSGKTEPYRHKALPSHGLLGRSNGSGYTLVVIHCRFNRRASAISASSKKNWGTSSGSWNPLLDELMRLTNGDAVDMGILLQGEAKSCDVPRRSVPRHP